MDLISEKYRQLNIKLHESSKRFLISYGTGGRQYRDVVESLCKYYRTNDVLDYGCGTGSLKDNLPEWISVKEYDPAIEGKSELPDPADIIICTDVLEHIEPEYLDAVLAHLECLMNMAGLFVISTTAAKKHLEDGRNAHLTIQSSDWWENKLSNFNIVTSIDAKKKTEFYLEAK